MWQRFTERARRVVFFAQEEAGRLGENYVSTEHLLLGLVRENDSVAARILDRIGSGSSTEAALHEVLHSDYDDLTRSTAEFLRKTYAR